MEHIKRYGKCLQVDLYRAFKFPRFLISVLMVVLVLSAAVLEGIALDTDVLYVFCIVMYGMPAMLVLIGGAFAYADSFCADREHKYISSLVLRGGMKEYVSAKVTAIFMTAMLCVGIGIFLFAMILHIRLPWADCMGSQYETLLAVGGLRFFLKHRMYPLYFLLWGLQYGMLAGILAVAASYLSLFIKNRMLVLATPFIAYYFADFVVASLFPGTYSIAAFFSASNNVFGQDMLAYFCSIAISVIVLLIMGLLIRKKIGREFLDE